VNNSYRYIIIYNFARFLEKTYQSLDVLLRCKHLFITYMLESDFKKDNYGMDDRISIAAGTGKGIFLLATASRPALGPDHPLF